MTPSCQKEREELWEDSRHLFGYLMSLKEGVLGGEHFSQVFLGTEVKRGKGEGRKEDESLLQTLCRTGPLWWQDRATQPLGWSIGFIKSVWLKLCSSPQN